MLSLKLEPRAPTLVPHEFPCRARPHAALACPAPRVPSRTALDGRFNCSAEDIASTAKVVLRHRLVLNYRAEADQMNADRLIDELLQGLKR